jgi:GWxTD domain-containing protein
MNNRHPYRVLVAALAMAVTAAWTAPSFAQGRFGLYANAFLDSTRTPRTRITVDVPFRTLIFLKKEGYFDARYDAFISIRNTSDRSSRPSTYVLHGFATVKTYEETRRRDQKSRTWREFKLAPGEYSIDATLTVENTQIALQRSVSLRVPDFLASGMGIGTPQILSVPVGTVPGFSRWADAAGKLASAPAPADASITGLDRQPAVRFSIFLKDSVSGSVPCDLFFEVVDPSDRQILYGKRLLQLTGKNDEFVLTFNADDWSPGLFKVNLRAQTHAPDRDASASVDLHVDFTRAMLGANFDDTLEILGLIASTDELKALRNAPESERAAAWAKFWAARDPDPSTPENEALIQYLQRVQYVDKEFSQFGPGWRSDRGRVYIRYGAPEQIDTAMDQGASQGEYEIWRYYGLGRTFVFYDMFGVGDYKLVQGDL